MPSRDQTPRIFLLTHALFMIIGYFMKIIKKLFGYGILLLSLPLFAEGPEQDKKLGFVTDELFVYMHAGAGNNYRIVGSITAGTQIQLTEQITNDYSQIIDDKNRTGWIETKYLTTKPGLRFVVAELNAQLASSTEDNQKLSRQLQQAKNKINQFSGNNSELNNEMANLKNQLASTEAQLKSQNTDIQKQWFFTGAIVLGIGLILGLLLPKLGGRRRRVDNW